MGQFADGLQAFFSKETFVKRCRITKNKKAAILEMIHETSECTCDMDDYEFELFMKTVRWLKFQLKISNEKQKLDAKLAGYIKFWLNDFDYYPFDGKDFDGACEWIMNKLSKKYSLAEMVLGLEKLPNFC